MQPATDSYKVTFLVVGGGIAGVSCAQTLAICCPEETILLLTESSIIKTIANLEPLARYLHRFDVTERATDAVDNAGLAACITTIVDQLIHIDANERTVQTKANRLISYKYVCICTGGQPRLVAQNNPCVLGIRDTDSVLELQRRLQNARSIVLLGNGGIATELAHELHGVEVHWVIKDKHIASTFVDPGAAYFFQQKSDKIVPAESAGAVKRLRYAEMLPSPENKELKRGAALGPDWHRKFELSGLSGIDGLNNLTMYYKSNLKNIETLTSENKLSVLLTTGECIKCDILVSATGVDPRHDFTCTPALEFNTDGGIAVNEMMETNLEGIYAAGDVCTATWSAAEHWFQMRLWTQARQMGSMAGRSMAAAFNGETIYQDFCFELFGHVTKLFGYEVVLLGRYNGQDLGTDYELLLRSTPGKEYIKFVLQNGRLRGAILIGNTELAETCENLILNGIDLTPFGDDILNPDIDIEDYFD